MQLGTVLREKPAGNPASSYLTQLSSSSWEIMTPLCLPFSQFSWPSLPPRLARLCTLTASPQKSVPMRFNRSIAGAVKFHASVKHSVTTHKKNNDKMKLRLEPCSGFLGGLTALAEDGTWVPSISVVAFRTSGPSSGLFWILRTCEEHLFTQAHTYTHTLRNNNSSKR